MKSRHTVVPAALLAAMGPIFGAQAMAADAAPAGDEDTSLATIVVTAEKREENLQNVPMSISAVSGNVLDNLNMRNFNDYAALVPGLSLLNSRPGYTTLTLRGQNAGGVGSTVAVYLDESPFGSSSALLNGSILSGDFNTYDLQRVEVLRGPQGTLYGSNSEGGLLKFVTNAPVLGSFSGAVETSAEGVAGGSNGGNISAVVNLPIGDKMAFRISGFDTDLPGYLDDPSRGQKDVNDGHQYGGRASFLVDPVDSLSVRLTATTQQSRYNGTNQEDADPVTFKPVHGDLGQERTFPEPSSFKYSNYAATINWDAGPFSILSNTAYSVLNSDAVTDYTNIAAAPGLSYGTALGGIGVSLDDRVNMTKTTQELRISSAPSDRLEWQVGGYFTRESGQLLEHLLGELLPDVTTLPGPPLEVAELASTYKETAGYANLTFHFNSQFDIQGGGRYSKNEQSASESLTGALVGPPQIFTTPSEGHVFTYSVAPRWHIDQNTMVYARLATGYRPGGPNALPPVAPPDVPREYGADKTTNIELGIHTSQLSGLFTLDFSVFHVDWKDIQLLEQVDNTGINGNGGKARSQGFEWTVGWVPVHGLTFQWSSAYTDAQLSTDAPAVHGVTGDWLPYAPKVSTTLDGEYTWSAFSNYKGFLGGTYAYIGTRKTDFGSASDLTSQVSLPSYNTMAARFGFDNEHYRFTVYGRNLSDARGITGYVYTGAPGLNGTISIIQPRTVGVTVAAKF